MACVTGRTYAGLREPHEISPTMTARSAKERIFFIPNTIKCIIMRTKVKKKTKIGYNLATFSVNLPRKRTKNAVKSPCEG
jgi:hypothetical protein